MSSRRFAGVALALLMAATPAFAQAQSEPQSLGELARQEEARRAGTAKARKSYSNVDLGPGGVPEPAPAAAPEDTSCYVSKETGKCAPAEEVIANSAEAAKMPEAAPPSEDTIRREANATRAELSRLQSEINALQAEAVNQSLGGAKRQLAGQTLEMNRQSLERVQRRWARLEKQVRELKLPHAWIEPVPDNAISRQ